MIRLAAILATILLAAGCGAPLVNTSSDGRVHSCHVVTEQGVTEHLDAYKARCGQ